MVWEEERIPGGKSRTAVQSKIQKGNSEQPHCAHRVLKKASCIIVYRDSGSGCTRF